MVTQGQQSSMPRTGPVVPAPGGSLFAEGFKETPYWWDDVAPPEPAEVTLPPTVDVAVVGSGYTGLNAALETARAGRSTVVLDAERAGWGCSTRNGGQISTSVKPGLAELARKYGAERAAAIRAEGRTALDWIGDFIGRQGIACDFVRPGRFHAAHTPEQYAAMGAQIDGLRREGIEAHLVPRTDQHSELGTDAYHGGTVFPRHAALDPAKYHQGLLRRAESAGAQILSFCPVLEIGRDGAGFVLRTPRGRIAARDVIVATNGYTGALVPWLTRRTIPIGSYVIATEPLPRDLIDRLFPTDRIVSDTRRVVYYYRASPDRTRVLFGGRVSASESDPKVSAPRLHAEMAGIFPELAEARLSHSWTGTVAYTFDTLAHCGVQDGIHYATGYCGSGVSMASYLGMRTGQKVLGLAEGRTAFDGLPFPTRPLYTGRPWFLPAVVAWYRWRDRREALRAARRLRGGAART